MSPALDYRKTLRDHLVERCQQNPQYSLRAFSRDIGITPAQLSQVLSRKRGLSLATARRIAQRIGLNEAEANRFCDLVESTGSRSRLARETAKLRLQRTQTQSTAHSLQLDAFKIVSDWYHFAILELLKLPRAHSDAAWIAARLQITELQARTALERLTRLELIEKKGDRLRPTSQSVAAPDGIPSEAIRKFHRQILEKALGAITTQDVSQRYFNTTLTPIEAQALPQAKADIKRFHAQFERKYGTSGTGDRVYALAVQLFNLTPTLESESL